MIKTTKIKWNSIIYDDCLNEENGLKTLPNKSFDLCLTDPPYNVDLDLSTNRRFTKKDVHNHKIFYNDKIENYESWCKKWFNELKRICNKIVMTVGNKNEGMWHRIEGPKDKLIHYKRNSISLTYICRANLYEPIFLYGKFKPFTFVKNVLDIPLQHGFYRKIGDKFINPAVKSLQLWEHLIMRIKPKSVLDCFMGSGTTAEVCHKFGIKWFGYEINPIYKKDIDKRLNHCKPLERPYQSYFDNFMEEKEMKEITIQKKKTIFDYFK